LRGELPPLVNPDIARDYVYADDVNDAYLLSATAAGQEPGAVYNIGTGIQTTLREVVAVARDTMTIADEPQWGTMSNRKWDTNVWVADNRAINVALGWKPRHTFADGFWKTVEWLRSNSAMRQFYDQQIARGII
jgi:dolichol-phosphate mannosyltransferase